MERPISPLTGIPVSGLRIRNDLFVDCEGDLKLAQSLGMLEVDHVVFNRRLRDVLNLELFIDGELLREARAALVLRPYA